MNIEVYTSGAFSGALERLRPIYESQTGDTITTTLAASLGDSSDTIPHRLARGEEPDLVIMIADELRRAGRRRSPAREHRRRAGRHHPRIRRAARQLGGG